MLAIPKRAGAKPKTFYDIPHHQLDQTPSPALYERLVERFLATPRTTNGPSLISVPGARALFLEEGCACNQGAFFRGREFAHVHPPSDGSFHMILSPRDCEHVLERGWGELHPLAATGQIQPTVTMVYAPRDDAEIEVALAVAEASRRYAETPVTSTARSRPR